MAAPRYGPDETWPSHSKSHWHQPLAQARAAGWTLVYVDAPHRFGVVRCPAGQHTFSVDRTARNSETLAKEAVKKITRCGHVGGRAHVEQQEAGRLLDMASRLTADVAEGLSEAEAKQDAYEDLDRLQLLLETAELTVADALAAQEAALEAAAAVDDAPAAPALSDKLDVAAGVVTKGESHVKALRSEHPEAAKPLLSHAAALRTRIGQLRYRVAALQGRHDSSSH